MFNSRDYVSLVNLIGILFQIRDDYQNLQDTQYTENKGFCEDITEGKFSFPIIHSIHSRPDETTVICTSLHQRSNQAILKQRTMSEDLKLYCVQYMRNETQSFAYTRKVLRELDTYIRNEIEQLGGNEKLLSVLNRLIIVSGIEDGVSG